MSRIFRNKGSWWIDYLDALGRRHRRKVGPDKRVATEALNATLTRVARRQWVGVVDDSAISFGTFADLWSTRVLPAVRPGTATRYAGIVANHLKPFFTGALRAIELGRVEAYVASRIEAGANPGSINNEVRTLKHILRRACKWRDAGGDPYLRQYPLEGLGPLRESPARCRFLDEDDLARLIMECERSRMRHLKAFVLVALNSGCRRNEVWNLQRKDIDWTHRTAALTVTKTGASRLVHLNQVAFDALRDLPARIDGRLFPAGDSQLVSRAFHNACVRAEIADFRLHDTRHHFASTHAMNGTNGRVLQALLGHADPRMTARYSHLSDRSIQEAANRVLIDVAPSNTATAAKKA